MMIEDRHDLEHQKDEAEHLAIVFVVAALVSVLVKLINSWTPAVSSLLLALIAIAIFCRASWKLAGQPDADAETP